MKKIVCFVLALLLVFPAGCGAPKPKSAYSEDAVSGMQEAIEILDTVLEAGMSTKTARPKLVAISARLEKSEELLDQVCALSISMVCSTLSFCAEDDFYEVRKCRDCLYESLYGK